MVSVLIWNEGRAFFGSASNVYCMNFFHQNAVVEYRMADRAARRLPVHQYLSVDQEKILSEKLKPRGREGREGDYSCLKNFMGKSTARGKWRGD